MMENLSQSKKIKIFFIFLGFLLLIISIPVVYFVDQRQKAKKELVREVKEEPVREKIPPLLSFEKLKSDILLYNSDYPIIVNSEPITWEELENAIRYDQEVWQIRGYDSSEEKRLLIERLVERKLIEQLARERGITEPTPEEIEEANLEMFGPGYDLSRLASYPGFHAQTKTKALKNKLERSLVKTYTGAFIYAKYKSIGADGMRRKGIDPQVKAREKVEEYDAFLGKKTLDEIIGQINADEEVMTLNDRAKIEKFVEIGIEELPNPDIKEEMRKLLPGQTSEIFVISGLFRPGSTVEEEYGYGFIKLEGGRAGEEEDFERFLEKEKEKAKIEVFI